MSLIQSQRNISCNSGLPGCNLFAFFQINYAKMGRAGERDESLRLLFFDLDSARAGVGLDIPNMLIVARIDDGEPAGFCIAESHVKIFCCWVVAHVIGIWADRQALNEFKCVTREYFAGAVSTVGNKKLFEVRRIK